nr:MAG TPA_asm: hypothetical protein [Bacteriophage sp.]
MIFLLHGRFLLTINPVSMNLTQLTQYLIKQLY